MSDDERAPNLCLHDFDAYSCALEFLSLVTEVLDDLPAEESNLGDQLDRASTSIPLNIAEGFGKRTERDKAHYYATARGSALECAAVFDVLARRNAVSDQKHDRALELIDRLVAMLSKLCR